MRIWMRDFDIPINTRSLDASCIVCDDKLKSSTQKGITQDFYHIIYIAFGPLRKTKAVCNKCVEECVREKVKKVIDEDNSIMEIKDD